MAEQIHARCILSGSQRQRHDVDRNAAVARPCGSLWAILMCVYNCLHHIKSHNLFVRSKPESAVMSSGIKP